MSLSRLKLLHALDRRYRRARPGSVLIIVIVLLLLLAILGAAYLSTTRSDRVASAQSVVSTDIDTAIDGVAKTCEGIIVDDLNDTAGNLYGATGLKANTIPTRTLYQGEATGGSGAPPTNPTVAAYNVGDVVNINTLGASNLFYYYYNSGVGSTTTTGAAITPAPPAANGGPTNGWQLLLGHLPFTATGSDPWLASRIPNVDALGNPIWPFVTQSIQVTAAGTSPASILGTPFEDPTYPLRVNGVGQPGNIPSTIIPFPPNTTLVGRSTTGGMGPLYPTQLKLPNGQYVPAFAYTSPNPASPATAFAAADADGDGIADSFLFRIPGMNLDALTWYAGVRIIDNNSAINVNTANSRDLDTFSGQTAPAAAPYFDNFWALFPTSVGLRELVNVNDLSPIPPAAPAWPLFKTLNNYRYGTSGTPGNVPSPWDESNNGTTVPPAANARADFNYVSFSDALYNESIRRLANPGWYTYTSPTATTGRYSPFPLSDEASLAYRFCLQNPNAFQQAFIENALANSLCGTSTTPTPPYAPYSPSNPSQPQYDPSGVAAWYGANFNYATGNSTLPIRALLVTRNPVSNYIQQLFQGTVGTDSQPLVEASAASGGAFMLPYGNLVPASTLNYMGVWSAATTYTAGQIVLYPGVPTAATGPNFTYMVTGTPAAGTAPATSGMPNTGWVLQPWTQSPVKANVNTASFEELFRAFWCVMAGNPPNTTPFGNTTPDPIVYDNGIASPQAQQQYEFRSPLRDPTINTPSAATQLDGPNPQTNTNCMLLRAALAAVNTLGMRDNSQNVISRTIYLNNAFVGGTKQSVEARVYSCAPNPIISEVYANTYADSSDPNGKTQGLSNPKGYVAIELFNPYSVPLVLHNWQVGYLNRQPTTVGGTYPNLQFNPMTGSTLAIGPMAPMNNVMPNGSPYASDTTDVIIPPQGYALLENYNASGRSVSGITPNPNDATYRNASSGLQATGLYTGYNNNTVDVWVTGLSNVIQDPGNAPSQGGEFYLLRPRRADGTYTSCSDPLNYFTEFANGAPNLYDLVPVDSYDFSNLIQSGPGAATYNVWSYIRGKGVATGNEAPQLFKGTYPGTYIPYNAVAGPRFTGTAGGQATTPPTNVIPGPIASTAEFGQYSTAGYTDNFPPIQVYTLGTALNMHFPNAVITQANKPQTPPAPAGGILKFPFGTFARNGDMLDIPFIGAYRIRLQSLVTANPQSPVFVEMNSLPMDCSMAAIDDGIASAATSIDGAENIGRFIPMRATQNFNAKIAAGTLSPNTPDFYSWTRNLFNYLTVESNSDAYLPNFDPNIEDLTVPTNQSLSGYATKYGYNTGSGNPTPTQLYTRDGAASDQVAQDNVGIDGLININTASWKVLSMLPMVTPAMELAANPHASPTQYITDNEALAQQIVLYRDGDGTAANPPHGPFTSIFDLNNVVGAAVAGAASGTNPPGFQNGWSTFDPTAANTNVSAGPTSALGLLSPADVNFGTEGPTATSNGIAEDYQSDCLNLMRISNLITTRSDTFTIYIVLQGWQNAGSTNASLPPQPMITRRYAVIVDRSAINSDPNSRFLKTLVVPND